MNYFDRRYNSTKYPIIITENGISSRGNGTDHFPEPGYHLNSLIELIIDKKESY